MARTHVKKGFKCTAFEIFNHLDLETLISTMGFEDELCLASEGLCICYRAETKIAIPFHRGLQYSRN